MPTITVAAGGCLETAVLPYHLMRLRAAYPDLEIRVALSPGALDFVKVLALEGITGVPVYTADRPWDSLTGRPTYLDLADADALLLYPATARVLCQCALGIVSCPVTRCFAFTSKGQVLITPYLHPRMESRLYTPHLDLLRSIGCRVAQPDDGLVWRTTSAWVATERELVEMLDLKSPQATPASWSAVRGASV
jgi:phosphopantothenoylcysteine synthetase/decarboxylase